MRRIERGNLTPSTLAIGFSLICYAMAFGASASTDHHETDISTGTPGPGLVIARGALVVFIASRLATVDGRRRVGRYLVAVGLLSLALSAYVGLTFNNESVLPAAAFSLLSIVAALVGVSRAKLEPPEFERLGAEMAAKYELNERLAANAFAELKRQNELRAKARTEKRPSTSNPQ